MWHLLDFSYSLIVAVQVSRLLSSDAYMCKYFRDKFLSNLIHHKVRVVLFFGSMILTREQKWSYILITNCFHDIFWTDLFYFFLWIYLFLGNWLDTHLFDTIRFRDPLIFYPLQSPSIHPITNGWLNGFIYYRLTLLNTKHVLTFQF